MLASLGSSLTNPASVLTLFYHNFMYSEASNQSVSAIPESDRVFFFLILQRALLANRNKQLGYLGHKQDRRKSFIKNQVPFPSSSFLNACTQESDWFVFDLLDLAKI